MEQEPLPKFRNNDERKEWLKNYRSWGIWYFDDHIGVKYYKYDFDNGARLIVEEYMVPATKWFRTYASPFYHLVGGPEPEEKDGVPKWTYHETYARYQNSISELMNFLRSIEKEQSRASGGNGKKMQQEAL